jgi:serine/threonine protein kinase
LLDTRGAVRRALSQMDISTLEVAPIELGSGKNGSVFLASVSVDDVRVDIAIKQACTVDAMRALWWECRVASHIRRMADAVGAPPLVVEPMWWGVTKKLGYPASAMPLAKFDGQQMLCSRTFVRDGRAIATFVREVAKSIRQMHSFGFAHMDVSLENVLVMKDGSIKIADCGLSIARRPSAELLARMTQEERADVRAAMFIVDVCDSLRLAACDAARACRPQAGRAAEVMNSTFMSAAVADMYRLTFEHVAHIAREMVAKGDDTSMEEWKLSNIAMEMRSRIACVSAMAARRTGMTSNAYEPVRRSKIGKLFYQAPEMSDESAETIDPFQCDVWSFGVLVFACVFMNFPFAKADAGDVGFETFRRGGARAVVDPRADSLDAMEAIRLIDACMSIDPAERPSFAQILEHSFFRE